MSLEDIINNINKEGLIILLMDDGTFNKHSKNGNFTLCAYQYSQEMRDKLIKRYNEILGVNGHEIGIKRKNIAFSSKDNKIFYNTMKEFIPLELDIIQQKFGYILKTNQI